MDKMDINRLKQLSGVASNKNKSVLVEAFDQGIKQGIERNSNRRGQPVLGPNGNDLPNTVVLTNEGNIIGVRAAGGMTIVIYDTLIEEKSDFFLPDEAIDALGSIEESVQEDDQMIEKYEPKYYTNSDEKMVRQLVAVHLGTLRKSQKFAKPISDYILSQELDMNQEQLEEYIEAILSGEFWYPGKRSPFPR